MPDFTWDQSGNYSGTDFLSGIDNSFSQNDWSSLAGALGYNQSPFEGSQADIANAGLDWSAGQGNWGMSPQYLTSGFQQALSPYSFQTNVSPEKNTIGVFDKDNKSIWNKTQWEPDDTLTQLVSMAAPMLAGGAFGGGLAGLFGGGFTGGALGQGLASGAISSGMGGDFGKGFLGGAIGGGLQGLSAGTPAVAGNNPSAYVPAQPGTSLAGSLGITSPTLGGMVNRGLGGALSSAVQGGSGSDVLKSGLTGGLLSGANSVGSSFLNSAFSALSGAGDNEFDSLPGNMVTNPDEQSPDPMAYSDEGGRFDNSAGFSYGIPTGGAIDTPDQQIQSAGGSPSAFSSFSGLPGIAGDMGRSFGNYAVNNVGDLASMLYGFYNNRRQQKALSGQMGQINQATSQLQNMFSQNSPYAQQLRAKLNAQAAQQGRRSNTAGRETQFQAMLADKAASTLPQIAQMQASMLPIQQQRGQLQNSLGSNLFNMFNKAGGFNVLGNGLQSLFNQNPMSNYSMLNNTSDYNTLGPR